AEFFGESFERGESVFAFGREIFKCAIRRGESGAQARISEKRDRRFRFDKNQVREVAEERLGGFGEVRDARGGGDAEAASEAAGIAVAVNGYAGGRGDAGGGAQSGFCESLAAEQNAGGFAGAQGLRNGQDSIALWNGSLMRRKGGSGITGFAPGEIGGDDEGRDLAGRSDGGGDGGCGCFAHRGCARESADPTGDGPGEGFDIGGERSIVAEVLRGVFADDVDDGGAGFARVVEVRERVAEARAEMEQRGGGFAGHAGVTIGRAGADAFEQAEDASHGGYAVEGGDELHLGGAGIHEADIDVVGKEGAEEGFGAGHIACLI